MPWSIGDGCIRGVGNERPEERAPEPAVEGAPERDELRASRRRMMRIREAERSHLASELHDGPVQDVQRILRSNLSSLARVIPTSDSDDLSELESTLRQIAGNLRDICTDLKPPVLAHLPLKNSPQSP